MVKAGSSAVAQALAGRTVAVAGGAMYAQYRCIDASQCLELPEGTPATAGASSFVNPLTALGMVETMRREGHSAIVHTAAASNLGQMLNKLCIEEQVPLRQHRPQTRAGGSPAGNRRSPCVQLDITIVHGRPHPGAHRHLGHPGLRCHRRGKLAGHILTCMEAALTANSGEYSRYGSTTHKQVYIYGGLDRGPTVFNRNFGMAWGIGGWLLTPFLQSIGPETFHNLRQRVACELETTFASTYTREVSLAEALQPDAFSVYAMHATGEKYLITPHKR